MMLPRKLIDWIKSEEAKGISDAKLKTTLRKRGWPDKDIDKAINLAHKGKVNWIPLIITFALVFVFALIFTSIIPFIVTFVMVIISLFYALVPYYKSNKQENYLELFILIFTSGLFSLVISLIFFNLLVLVIHLTGLSVTVPLLIIIPALSIVLLFYIFYLTISKLSKHFIGYFDHESYFRFKHWPFKIFNVNWKRKWTLLKYPVLVIIVGLVVAGFMFDNMVEEHKDSRKEILLSVQEQLRLQLLENCLDNFIEEKNIVIVDEQPIPILFSENEFLYSAESFLDVDLIYFNCDFQKFTCQEKEWDLSKRLEEQTSLKEGKEYITKIKTENKTIIMVPGECSDEELLSYSSTFDQEQLGLKIVQEVEGYRKNLFLKVLERVPPELTWSNFFDETINSIVFFMAYGIELSFYQTQQKVIAHEGNFTGRGVFYDGTESLSEHITNLEENIKVLYPRFLAIDFDERIASQGGSGWAVSYSYRYPLSFDKSWEYLIGRITYLEDLGEKIIEIQKRYFTEPVKQLYQTKDIEESLESKAIRLKIIETLLARPLANNCQDYQVDQQDVQNYKKNCYTELAELTGTPELFLSERERKYVR